MVYTNTPSNFLRQRTNSLEGLFAGHTRKEFKVSGISNRLKYSAILIAYTQFTNVAVGRLIILVKQGPSGHIRGPGFWNPCSIKFHCS